MSAVPTAPTSPPRYRFADLTLDIGQRRLTRGQESLPLSKLTFALLRVLVETAPNMVPHAELAEKVWGPRRIVTPESLAKGVMRLREALGDDAGEPRYVEGLRGQGYRLMPAVERVGATEPRRNVASLPLAAIAHARPPAVSVTAHPTVPEPTEPRGHAERHRRLRPDRRLIALAAAVALAAALASGAYLSQRLFGRMGPADAAPSAVAAPMGSAPAAASSAATTPSATTSSATKIVVVPFVSLSSDAEQRYLVDGLTDELIVNLQRLPGMQVTGRTTSFALRGSGRSAKEIAAELGVKYVLEGSVGTDGKRLRVRAQLSDASGFTVVPYSYEGALENVFRMQDDIVGAIAAAVRAPLGLENAVGHAGTESLEAYELYVAARRECAEGHLTPEGFERALRRIERAVAIDPNFARAWMFKSQVHSMRAAFTAENASELVAADDAAARAIALAPDNGEGYNARALLRGTKGDWHGAVRDYQRAQALGFMQSPDVPVLIASGRIHDVRALIEQLLETDQLNEDLLGFLAVAHEIMADPDGADEIYRRGTRLYDPWEFGDVVGMWIGLGRERSGPPYADIAVAPPFAAFAEHAGQPDRALALIKRAARDPAYQAATVLASLAVWAAHFGDDKLALELLTRSLHGVALYSYLAWLPVFHDVRALPEFKQLLRDIGLVDYWRSTGWPDVCRPVGADDFNCA